MLIFRLSACYSCGCCTMLKLGRTVQGAVKCIAGVVTPVRHASGSSGDSLKHTVLYDFHIANGGKMVGFADYAMPVQYGSVGIGASHKTVRSACGLFDVSHMLQWRLWGAGRVDFLERLVVADIAGLEENTGTLSLFTNPEGGIVDDLIVNRTDQSYLYVVSNAGCREKDLAHLRKYLAEFKAEGGDVHLEIIEDHGLIALQGPNSAAILEVIYTDAHMHTHIHTCTYSFSHITLIMLHQNTVKYCSNISIYL